MGQLTNQYVSSSYQGLLKMTNSTTGVTGTLQTVQTGDGTDTPLQLSQTEIGISGSIKTNSNITFSNSAFNSLTETSGALYFSTLNNGTLHLNDDGGEGDVFIGYGPNNTHIRGNTIVTGSIDITGGYYINGIAITGSEISGFATTGSNRFNGDQTITGAIFMAENNSIVFKSGSNSGGISVSDGGSNIILRYDLMSLNNPNGELGMSARDNINIGSDVGTVVYSTQNGQVSYFGPNGIYVNNSDNSSNTHIYTEPSGSGKSNVISNSDLTIKAGNSGTNRMDLNGDLYINGTPYGGGGSGTSGTSGSNGTDGTSGSNGTDGTSGTSGSNGTDGSSGTSGSNGTDGYSGTSGLTDKTGLITTGSLGTSQSISGSLNVTGSITGSNDIQINSITIGRGGGNAVTNLAIGPVALGNNVFGTNNIAIGSGSLTGLISGSSNIGIGNGTLSILSGSTAQTIQNVIIGNVSGQNLINGARNTIVGHQALGGDNVNRNTGIGRGVLVGLGNITIPGFGSGSQYNVGVGHNTAFTFNSGSNNVFINGGTANGEGLRSGSNNTVVGPTALPVEMNNSTIIGLISSAATIGTSPVTNSVIIADGQGNVMIRKDGSTGTVKFPTSVEITGSLYVSSSVQKDVIVDGQIWVSSSLTTATTSTTQPQVNVAGYISPTRRGTSQVNPGNITLYQSSSVNGEGTIVIGPSGGISATNNDSFGGQLYAQGIGSSETMNYTEYKGIYNTDGTLDIEQSFNVNSSGSFWGDWNNSTFEYSNWMSLAPNNGDNPAPQMLRGLVITGSLTVTGGINYSSGSNQTVGTAVLDGANPGTVTVSNSLVTTSSLIFLTKQTLTNTHMVAVSSKGSGTFTLTSNGNGDAATVAYQIINPA